MRLYEILMWHVVIISFLRDGTRAETKEEENVAKLRNGQRKLNILSMYSSQIYGSPQSDLFRTSQTEN